MAIGPHRGSVDTTNPPPSYTTRRDSIPIAQRTPYRSSSPEPQRKRPRRWASTILFCASQLLLVLALVLGVLILVSGTSKNGDSSILLEDFDILDIPIKYSFLCPEDTRAWECDAVWGIKMYLNGVWAYRDAQGDSRPLYHLWNRPGRLFNLTDAMTIMDDVIDLQPDDYTTPTTPTQHFREMSPVPTRITFALFLVAMVLIVLLFVLWSLEWCARARLIQRRWVLLVLLVTFACSLFGTAWLAAKASKAMSQTHGNSEYSSGPTKASSFGSRFQGLLAGFEVAQAFALIFYGLHALLEKKEGKKPLKRTKPAAEDGGERGNADVPPQYTAEMTDLEIIRMTELQTLERLAMRQSRDSISEISRLSFSRTPERRDSYTLNRAPADSQQTETQTGK